MEEQIKLSWWKRNWKWVVPTGGCLTLIIIAVAFLSYGVYKVKDVFSENSSLFTFLNVIQEVQKSPEVNEAIGKSIRFDDLENIDYDPAENKDRLDLDFEIQGSDADGVVRVLANKTEDGWQYTTFTITVSATGEVIDLKDQANE